MNTAFEGEIIKTNESIDYDYMKIRYKKTFYSIKKSHILVPVCVELKENGASKEAVCIEKCSNNENIITQEEAVGIENDETNDKAITKDNLITNEKVITKENDKTNGNVITNEKAITKGNIMIIL
jgi:hypothetical protein